VAEKLDKWSSHEVVNPAGTWQEDVEEGQNWETDADGDGEHQLANDVLTTVSRQTLEPERCQQLLTVSVCNELQDSHISIIINSSSSSISSGL